MTNSYEDLLIRRESIKKKLSLVILKQGLETTSCWIVGNNLKVSGTTVKNYLSGKVADGYLAEAIHNEFTRLNNIK